MKQVKFTLNLSEEQIMETIKRYHFSEEDLPALCSFFQALKPLIQGKAYYEVIKEPKEKPDNLQFVEEQSFLVAIVTLGKGADKLHELYLEAEDILAAYMIDCLSFDLLSQAYDKLAGQIEKEEKLYIEKYEFLGGKYPLERMDEIFQYFSQDEVTYNDAYMLLPQKSVVYLGKLTEIKEESCRHICACCDNTTCPNRQPLPYGYQRIFGKEKVEPA